MSCEYCCKKPYNCPSKTALTGAYISNETMELRYSSVRHMKWLKDIPEDEYRFEDDKYGLFLLRNNLTNENKYYCSLICLNKHSRLDRLLEQFTFSSQGAGSLKFHKVDIMKYAQKEIDDEEKVTERTQLLEAVKEELCDNFTKLLMIQHDEIPVADKCTSERTLYQSRIKIVNRLSGYSLEEKRTILDQQLIRSKHNFCKKRTGLIEPDYSSDEASEENSEESDEVTIDSEEPDEASEDNSEESDEVTIESEEPDEVSDEVSEDKLIQALNKDLETVTKEKIDIQEKLYDFQAELLQEKEYVMFLKKDIEDANEKIEKQRMKIKKLIEDNEQLIKDNFEKEQLRKPYFVSEMIESLDRVSLEEDVIRKQILIYKELLELVY